MKKSLIISIVLIVLLVIVSGILIINKDEKKLDKRDNDVEEKEVLSNNDEIDNKEELKEVNEDESNVNDIKKKDEVNVKKEESSTSNKNNKVTNNNTKKSISQNSNVNNKSIESKKDETNINSDGALAMYYKSISCVEEESGDGYKMTMNYRADFPAYKGKEFSKETEMDYSIIEMIIRIPGYEQLEGEDKQELDDILDELKSSIPGYILNYSHQSDYINYTWNGDKKDFLNIADDFGSNKVTYNNYLSYFKKQGIACKES